MNDYNLNDNPLYGGPTHHLQYVPSHLTQGEGDLDMDGDLSLAEQAFGDLITGDSGEVDIMVGAPRGSRAAKRNNNPKAGLDGKFPFFRFAGLEISATLNRIKEKGSKATIMKGIEDFCFETPFPERQMSVSASGGDYTLTYSPTANEPFPAFSVQWATSHQDFKPNQQVSISISIPLNDGSVVQLSAPLTARLNRQQGALFVIPYRLFAEEYLPAKGVASSTAPITVVLSNFYQGTASDKFNVSGDVYGANSKWVQGLRKRNSRMSQTLK